MAQIDEKIAEARGAGYTDSEIGGYIEQKRQEAYRDGYTRSEVDAYLGIKEPDDSLLEPVARAMVSQREAGSLLDNFVAGFQGTSAGLIARGKLPAVVTPQDASFLDTLANAAGGLAGELPASVVGLVGGAAGGAALGAPVGGIGAVPGAILGGGTGAAALPVYLRESLIDAYEHGDYNGFSDWWSRMGAILLKTGRAGAAGAITGPIGAKAQIAVSKVAPQAIAVGSNVVSQALSFTAAHSALEGKIPDKDTLLTTAAVALAIPVAHGIYSTAGKLRPGIETVAKNAGQIFVRNALAPEELLDLAKRDPVVKQEMLAVAPSGKPARPHIDRATIDRTEGFTIEAFHGTNKDISVFDLARLGEASKAKDAELAFFFSQSGETAAGYAITAGPEGANVLPVRLRLKNPRIVDMKGANYQQSVFVAEILNAKRTGNDGVIFQNVNDITAGADTLGTTYAVFAPDQVRGKYGGLSDIGLKPGELSSEARRVAAVGRAERALDEEQLGVGVAERVLTKIQSNFSRLVQEEGGAVKVPASKEVPLSAEQLKILSRLGERPVRNRWLDALNPNRLHSQLVNEIAPVRRMVAEIDGSILETEIDPSIWTRQTYASAARASYNVRFGTIDFKTLEKTSTDSIIGGLQDAIKKGGSYEGMNAYKMAKTTIERSRRNIETGVDLEAAQKVAHDTAGVYAEGFEQGNRAKIGALRYYADSGMMAERQFEAAVQSNIDHAPLNRVFEDEYTAITKGKRPRQVVKEAKGSERLILDPTQTEIENMFLRYSIADRNRAVGSVVDLFEEFPETMGQYVEKTTKKIVPTEATAKEVQKYLEERGFDSEEIAAYATDPLMIFRARPSLLGKDEVPYFKDGKATIYRFKDPEIARIFQSLDPSPANIFMRAAEKVASFKRAGITGAPDFPVRGTLKDQPNVAVLTDNAYRPYWDWFRGLTSVMGKDEVYKEWQRNGGMGAALADMDVNYLQKEIHNLFEQTGVTGQVWNSVKNPVETMQIFQEFLDATTRVGVFKRLGETRPGMPAVVRATRARRAALDFSQRGSVQWVQSMARITPFLRPSILGLEQLTIAIKERPVSTAAKGAAYITAPSVSLWLLNYAYDQSLDPDDPEQAAQMYKNLPRWQRDNYWILPPVDGVRIRIPKPQVTGILFGAMAERFLDYVVEQDPRAFKDFDQTLIGSLVPPFIPAILLPIGEVWANKNSFTNKPLIPSYLEGASGYMQYTSNTSETAKKLSQWLSKDLGIGIVEVSPVIIENYVRGWLGSVGLEALHILDAPLRTAPGVARGIEAIPFVKSFIVRNPTMGAAPIQDFYDARDEFAKRLKDFTIAQERLSATEMERAAGFPEAAFRLDTFADALSGHASLIRAITASEDMTPVEKREYIDMLYAAMIGTARAGLEVIDEAKAGFNAP